MEEHSPKHVEQSRFSISLLKWLALVSVALLPFSFSNGAADWRYLVVAPFAGGAWILTLAYYWRSESILSSAATFLILIVSHHLSDNVYDGDPPFGHFLQWMSAFLVVAAIPIFLFHQRLLKHCGLQNPSAEQAMASNGP
jgi:hypothetical protein